jgi:hypothetical protein
MKIALDYDNTYSASPAFWRAFGTLARLHGHEVRIVTARDERHDRTAPLIEVEKHFEVIYCRGIAKKWYLTHFGGGFQPDVWVDDKPESILENSAFSPDGLAQWRAARDELSA